MNPITIHITGRISQTPDQICAALLDTERWPEFQGYSILPGIRSARFKIKTPNLIGSRIAVQNTDGSSHVEEIIAWDVNRTVALQFQDFSPPLKYLATHFVETWTFTTSPQGTSARRALAMYPKNVLGWLALQPIAQLMKKAFEKQYATFNT